jgi:hypothetical protein
LILSADIDIVLPDGKGPRRIHEENSLGLDGQETVMGPVSLSFKRLDDSTFDIISKLNTKGDHIFGEVSHSAVSPDGKSLIETKTQSEREAEPKGEDKSTGAVLRTSTSVLVFSKLPEHE